MPNYNPFFTPPTPGKKPSRDVTLHPDGTATDPDKLAREAQEKFRKEHPIKATIQDGTEGLFDFIKGLTVGGSEQDWEQRNTAAMTGEAVGAMPGLGAIGAAGTLASKGRGFFSQLDEFMKGANLPKSAHPNKWGQLFQGGNVKPEELELRKVRELLGNKPAVTLDEMRAHLQANPVPKITTTTLGDGKPGQAKKNMQAARQYLREVHRTGDPEMIRNAQERFVRAEEALAASGATEFNRQPLVLPGGQKYREDLMHVEVPGAPPRVSVSNVFQVDNKPTTWEPDHFKQHAPTMHVRRNDRQTADGAWIRWVEEVQSDLHQDGKKFGYLGEGGPDGKALEAKDAELRAIRNQIENLHFKDEMRRAREGPGDIVTATPDPQIDQNIAALQQQYRILQTARDRMKIAPPPAPLRDAWPEAAMKKQIMDVSEDPKLQGIGFTTGQTQTERYDLSKTIGGLRYDPQSHNLLVLRKGGGVHEQLTVPPAQLGDHIGGELASKLLATDPQPWGPQKAPTHMVDGLDLQTGGEGMNAFYDQLLRKRMEKLLKPFGATVERGEVATAPPKLSVDINGAGEPTQMWNDQENILSFLPGTTPAQAGDLKKVAAQQRMGSEPAWIARLTPEQKQMIREQGFPAFLALLAAGGAGGVAGQPEPQ